MTHGRSSGREDVMRADDGDSATAALARSAQIAAKALDAFAGILKIRVLGGVRNSEGRAEAERRTLHDRDTFGFEQLGDEVLVIGDHLASWRRLADRAGAGRVNIKG